MSNNSNYYSELDRAKEIIENAMSTHAPSKTKNKKKGNLAVNSAEKSFALGILALEQYVRDLLEHHDDEDAVEKPVIGHPTLEEVAVLIKKAQDKRNDDTKTIYINNNNTINSELEDQEGQEDQEDQEDQEEAEAIKRYLIFQEKLQALYSALEDKFQVGFSKQGRNMGNVLSDGNNNQRGGRRRSTKTRKVKKTRKTNHKNRKTRHR